MWAVSLPIMLIRIILVSSRYDIMLFWHELRLLKSFPIIVHTIHHNVGEYVLTLVPSHARLKKLVSTDVENIVGAGYQVKYVLLLYFLGLRRRGRSEDDLGEQHKGSDSDNPGRISTSKQECHQVRSRQGDVAQDELSDDKA